VDAALHRIVETQSGMEQDAAQEYMHAMKEEHRYHRDVY
jgi:sulfite reductase (NADPH) flavoprotein alpha-component